MPAGGRPQLSALGRLARPIREFVQTEASSSLVLLFAATAALVWANSSWSPAYSSLRDASLRVPAGGLHLPGDLRGWVNEGLMTVFFFVVGLEVKRELVRGELHDARKAVLPVFAALGGMLVPAAIYAALNRDGPGSAGWGIPMATDIAFALGVVTMLGPRVPVSLEVLLVSLAIIDDIGAIVVVAAFYSGGIAWPALGLALGALGLVAVLRVVRFPWLGPAYLVLGAAAWVAAAQSGVHATLTGVALALLMPAGPLAERLEARLHPATSFVVLPLFALANAGVPIDGGTLAAGLGSPVGLGIVLALVVGKPLGVVAFSWAAVRLRLASLPDDVRPRDFAGVAALTGIGFTVSLFVAELAFSGGALGETSKVAILAGSLVSGLAGTAILLARGGERA